MAYWQLQQNVTILIEEWLEGDKVMLRNEKNRLTPESNLDLAENQRQIQEIYNQWRDKGYSVEEVYYMISTAAHECVLDEALTGKRRETKQ